ncbi:DNA repair ATPase [Pontibacter pamirensis]|uniref:DNA repair ATPase n=1 Tax=Pontibacter pamirensis TaxID=2562824 RepID=UPI001389F4E2|nr:DNA repair ATPase [Pontibacter pamirensis]
MRRIILVVFLLISGICQAQMVQVVEKEQEVNGVIRRGQQLSVHIDTKTTEKAWKDYLSKKAGRVKSSKGVLTVEGAVIDTISSTPLRVISLVGSNAQGSNIWWTLDMGVAYVDKDATPKEHAAAESFLRGFARKLYREDVLRQINEAEEVLRATKSEQDRVVKEANSIQSQIDKNRQRKQDLEAELVRNAEELKQLELNVEHNVKQQEVSRQQVQDMEKSVEAVRDKLKAIK